MRASAASAGLLAAALLAACSVTSSTSPGASSLGTAECDEDDVPAAESYLERVVAETKERWTIPPGLEDADVVWVHLVFDPQGRVLAAAATSGDERLAESLLRVLREPTAAGSPPPCLVGIDLALRFDNPAYGATP